MKLELWAIIDVSEKRKPRFCYAHSNKRNGAMALYDRKPKIEKYWRPFKKVVKVKLTTLPIVRGKIKEYET